MKLTRQELQRLYGEAAFEAEVWLARANDYKRQLLDLYNEMKTDSPPSLNGHQQSKE